MKLNNNAPASYFNSNARNFRFLFCFLFFLKEIACREEKERVIVSQSLLMVLDFKVLVNN